MLKFNKSDFNSIIFRLICIAVFSAGFSGCIKYNYLAFTSNQPGEVTERLSKISNKVTDISISGEMGVTDTQTLIELAMESDILTRIDLSDCNVKLPHHAFAGCAYLKDVKLPNYNMEVIPHHMFSGCTSLSYIRIGSNCRIIEDNAFSNCTSLQTLYLPESVEQIGKESFKDCLSISSITCASKTPPTCSSYSFLNVNNDCKLLVPKGSASQYRNAVGWEKFKNIEEVKYIKDKQRIRK